MRPAFAVVASALLAACAVPLPSVAPPRTPVDNPSMCCTPAVTESAPTPTAPGLIRCAFIPETGNQTYAIDNAASLFRECDVAAIVRPSRGLDEVLTAAPDVLGRLTFLFADTICGGRLIRLTKTPGTTPIAPYTFIVGPSLPSGQWFTAQVEWAVPKGPTECPGEGVYRFARVQLADWPEIPLSSPDGTPVHHGPGST
jgi:hypothetical protein